MSCDIGCALLGIRERASERAARTKKWIKQDQLAPKQDGSSFANAIKFSAQTELCANNALLCAKRHHLVSPFGIFVSYNYLSRVSLSK